MNWRICTILATVIALLLLGLLIASYAGWGWLTFETASHMATVAGAIVGTVTLLSIAIQLAQQAQLARAANSQSFISISSEFVLTVAADETLSEIWQTKGENYETLATIEKARYRYLVVWWLNFFENLQYQRACGLIDADVYEAWVGDERGFINRRHVEKVWDEVKANYGSQFVRHFQPLIDARRQTLSAGASSALSASGQQHP